MNWLGRDSVGGEARIAQCGGCGSRVGRPDLRILFPEFLSPESEDFIHGWVTFWAARLSIPDQFPLAQAFFKAVINHDFTDDPAANENLAWELAA
jgi:hypothetical protein